MAKIILSLLLIISFIVSGCSVVKVPKNTGVDKDNGAVQYSYTHHWTEVPKVDWSQSIRGADATCKSLGYSGASNNPTIETNCTRVLQSGRCANFSVYANIDCKKTPDQIALIQERQAKIKAEKIAEENEKKRAKLESTGEYIYDEKGDGSSNTTDKSTFLKKCAKTDGISKTGFNAVKNMLWMYYRKEHDFIYEAGSGVTSGQRIWTDSLGDCRFDFDVYGVYKGTTISSSFTCNVIGLQDLKDGSFLVTDVSSCQKK